MVHSKPERTASSKRAGCRVWVYRVEKFNVLGGCKSADVSKLPMGRDGERKSHQNEALISGSALCKSNLVPHINVRGCEEKLRLRNTNCCQRLVRFVPHTGRVAVRLDHPRPRPKKLTTMMMVLIAILPDDSGPRGQCK